MDINRKPLPAVINYNPLEDGNLPSSSVKMSKFRNLPREQQKIFQFDRGFYKFRANKLNAHRNIDAYYQKQNNANTSYVAKFLAETLAKEWSEWFILSKQKAGFKLSCDVTGDILFFDKNWQLVFPKDKYVDAIDAIAMQMSEDFAICTFEKEKDEISLIHLMSPSGWSAEWAIGKTFAEIHDKVLNPKGGLLIKSPSKVIKGVINSSEPLQRVGAITFRSDAILNRMPEKNVKDKWNFDAYQKFYLRYERQVIKGLPEINGFLFTIKTCYEDLLHPDNISNAISALKNIGDNPYNKSFLNNYRDMAINFLVGHKERINNNERKTAVGNR